MGNRGALDALNAGSIPASPTIKIKEVEMEAKKKMCLEPKFFHYKDKKIPILQYIKAGYEKLLPLYLKVRVK